MDPLQQCPMKETDEHRQMRRIAFVAVVVSTVKIFKDTIRELENIRKSISLLGREVIEELEP